MAKKKEKSGGQEREGISPALWLVPVLAVIDLLYYFLLSMGYGLPTFGLSMWAINIGSIGIQGALLVILAVSHALDRRASVVCEDETEGTDVEEVEQAPAPRSRAASTAATAAAAAAAAKAAPRAAAPAPKAPEMAAKPAGREVFEYPPKVSGGIYADSHIPIGEGRFLKLRTLIARSCLLCDEQGKCWDIVRTDVEQEFFRSNIDCKEGLKIES
jgi:hypothetical protein